MPSDPITPAWESDSAYLRRIGVVLRRRLGVVLGTFSLCFLLALAAAILIPTRYTSSTTVLVDTRITKILQQDDVLGRIGTENAAIESEVEILQSSSLTRRVAEKLRLDVDPQFGAPPSLTSRIVAWWKGVPPKLPNFQNDGVETDTLVQRVAKDLNVKRVGLTYVLEISYNAASAERAAEIANTYAELYLDDQKRAKQRATQRANEWLNARVDELRSKVVEAEKAVEEYKAANGLFDVSGELLPEQQIARVSEQYVAVRALTSDAKAKYDQLRAAAAQGEAGLSAFSDTIQLGAIRDLRMQMGQLSRQEGDLLTRYGPMHPKVMSVRGEIRALQQQISQEINRILGAAKNDFEVAQAKEKAIEANLAQVKATASVTNGATVRLKELTRDSDATRDLFKSFLLRAKETSEQQSLQSADARQLAVATPHIKPSQPNIPLILGIGIIVGLTLGSGLALLFEGFNQTLRSSDEVEAKVGLPHVASLVRLKAGRTVGYVIDRVVSAIFSPFLWIASIVTFGRTKREPLRATPNQRYAVEHSASPYAEGIRSIRFALRHVASLRRTDAGGGVVAVASALPNEGKSTTAANLAHYIAHAGDRVLLIDCDVRNPTLSEGAAGGHNAGLIEAVLGQVPLEKALTTDNVSGLHVLALSKESRKSMQTGEIFSSVSFSKFIAATRAHYDLIILDLAPLLPVVDGRIVLDKADAALMVVRWNDTELSAVKAALKEASSSATKIIGVVLNDIDPDLQVSQDYYRSRSYMKKFPHYYGKV
jgi:polysaccharide biosynthesis transport protein